MAVHVEGRDHQSGDDFIRATDGDPFDIYVSIRVDERYHPAAAADQHFIAAARNAIPGFIAEVRRLNDGLASLILLGATAAIAAVSAAAISVDRSLQR